MNESSNIEFWKHFRRERKSFRGSIFQMLKVVLFCGHGWSIRFNTLERLRTLSTIHNQAFLPKLFNFIKVGTRSWWSLSLAASLPFPDPPVPKIPPNGGTQARFPTKYLAMTEPILSCGCTGSFWHLERGRLLWFLGGGPHQKPGRMYSQSCPL